MKVNLFLPIKLQPDLIIRAILQSASTLRSKIKIEIIKPGPKPEVVERQKIAKERATQRVRSWTVQNEMRSVLVRVSTSAARRIFDSANSRERGA